MIGGYAGSLEREANVHAGRLNSRQGASYRCGLRHLILASDENGDPVR